MNENLMQALEMLGQGMLGIFVVLGIIALLVVLIRQSGGSHPVVHQEGHQLVNAGGAGGNARNRDVAARLLRNSDAIVFTEKTGGLLLVNGEKIVETAGVSSLVCTLAGRNFYFHDIVSPFLQGF